MMNKLEKLSKREREVLSLMSNVLSDEEIMKTKLNKHVL